MRRQHPHHPSPFGDGAPCPPNLPNPSMFFNPEFLNQQHQFIQHPSFQNPFLQNPNFRPLLPQHNVNLKHRVSIEMVEEEALKAHKELVTAGESVNAWKVSQAALVSLQVDSWSPLGFQIQDVAFLRKLLFTEGKVNAFIHCFVAAQKITTLHDLEVEICKNESIEHFEELGLGPLCRHPLAQHYFLVPSGLMEIFKISSEDIITCLHSYMAKNKKLPISPDELITFIAGKKSVPHKEHLGVRIHSLGMHVSFIRQAVKSEQTILNNSLGLIKTETGKAQPPSSISTPVEKQLLDQRFDSISDRVKSFSSICNVATGKHTNFVNSSSDYDSDEYEDNVNKKNSNTNPPKILSSNNDTNSQSCPYPSAAEEMKRLGLKLNSSEKLNSPKDKLMDFQGSRSSGKKQKRKRQEKHGDIMKKYLKQDNNLQKSHQEEKKMIDLVKEKDSYIFPEADMGKFVTTWKEACCKGTVAEETMSQNPTSSHSSSSKPEKVDLNILDVPVSKNAGKIAIRIDKLVRAHVSISYSSWDKVPETYKDDVWTELVKIYELDPLSKEHFFIKMSESFRRHKSDLRASYYDTFNNDEERMENCPPTIAQEDWDEFLKNEATPGASERREEDKKKRSMLGYGHHTGCKSHAIIEQEMLVASPSTKIKRRQVWEKTHTKTDGGISDASSSYFDQIAKAKEMINDSDEDKLSLDEDILSQVFGKDARGMSRSIGTKIPSTQVKACAIASKPLIQAHGDNDEMKTRVEILEGKIKLLVGMVQRIAKQGNHAPDSASYGGSGTQFIAPQFVAPHFMNSTNVVINQKCEILNFDLETIATGTVCRDSTSSNIHGKSVPSTHEKLVLDNILLPDERTVKINHQFAETFGDVGVGEYVCHPKATIRYL